jgi:hypothetical protein
MDPRSPRQHLAFWFTLKDLAARGACSASAREGAYQAFKLVEQEAAEKQAYWLSIIAQSAPSAAEPRAKR